MAIRPLNGARSAGFEELCSQLARYESPENSHFVRKGTPDGGVECFTIHPDSSEWGWQAKFFDALGVSQWAQIDKSVKTALEKHPRLTRYYVCTPQDRPDARVDGNKSALDRWNEYVQAWKTLAEEKGMQVEFMYWGGHELLDRLSQQRHVGRVRFWFDAHAFDGVWFNSRLEEAIKSAGPRYTPEIHVELPIAYDLDAFGRTQPFFDRVKSLARKVREGFRRIGYPNIKDMNPDLAQAEKDLLASGQAILSSFGQISLQPIGPLPFQEIIELVVKAESLSEAGLKIALKCEEAFRSQEDEQNERDSSQRENPYRKWQYRVHDLASMLDTTKDALKHADSIGGNSLMVLRGEAGTGKTHLLCDITKSRVGSDLPTVLLMGQRFTSNEDPWTQALQHLDLRGLTAEEFSGALESAAQAANSRALVMVDAVNEGSGRLIWPEHMSAFLAHLERSPWIGVILSVRSTYEDFVLPKPVVSRAVRVKHHGFAEHEYDAARTFFVYYGLELPSTPLLAPEFRNPLFLKTLCKGLRDNGERRLPRGFHGITAVFDLYLKTINEKLAKDLGFNPKSQLVRQGMEEVAKGMIASDKGWMELSKAEATLNAILPGRDFERSLYRGLVSEGLLIEDIPHTMEGNKAPVCLIGYERLGDHMVARTLLDTVLPGMDPTSIFNSGSPLGFLTEEGHYISPGLLEALCIQVPERTGQEFPILAPKVMNHWNIGDAFRHSLIWRTLTAFTAQTRDLLNQFVRVKGDLEETIDFLLTVAVLPGHPFNANFLDARLRKDLMPDRDSWWSTYIHGAWKSRGALDRLIDWAGSVASVEKVDDEAIDLAAIALGWMFSSSNRFLRDHTTLALVNLLFKRSESIVRLIEQFASTDDLYVRERIYAVAYGIVMKMQDPGEIAKVAECVYKHVFEAGAPPPHVLLRDYARGVVERALYVGSAIQVDEKLLRPPYKSEWPIIPTGEQIGPLLPDWSRGDYDKGELDWAYNKIGSSVMSGDFAHYVVGTNSSSTSSHWLSLRLVDPAWQPPPRFEDCIAPILERLTEAQKAAWEAFEKAEQELEAENLKGLLDSWMQRANGDLDSDLETPDEQEDNIAFRPQSSPSAGIAQFEKNRAESLFSLVAILPPELAEILESALKTKSVSNAESRPPGFDLTMMQRYILSRVFELGWTKERFGNFDRFEIGNHGRDSSKAERIGKKYQWIAYHEFLAFLSDHYQFREGYGQAVQGRSFQGPWQDDLRDIDPSRPIEVYPEETDREGHVQAWWASEQFEDWNSPLEPNDWVQRLDNLPRVVNLLVSTNPKDGSKWINLQSHFNWVQEPPADRETSDFERREVWYSCTGYLIQKEFAPAFVEWAKGMDFWGQWMPGQGEVYQMYLGEHGWAAASNHFQKQYGEDVGWKLPEPNCPAKVHTCSLEYACSKGGLDCSIIQGFRLKLLNANIVNDIGLIWSGDGVNFLDKNDRLAAFDPSAHAQGPSVLLVRDDVFKEYLATKNLALCWTVLGEKRFIGPGTTPKNYADIHMSGAYQLGSSGPVGFSRWLTEKLRLGSID